MAIFAAQAITSSGEPFTSKHFAKIFILCLSYANLCFLNVWLEINDRYDFWSKYVYTWSMIAALTLDILIVACVTWGIVYAALRTGNSSWIRLLKWCTILALLVPINVLRTDEAIVSMSRIQIPHVFALRMAMVAASMGLGLLVLLNWQRFSARVTTILLILMAPALPVAFGTALLHVIQGPPGGHFPDKPRQPALPQPRDAAHVIWVLFDEWDDALTFKERPAAISLPEVDRFQQQAFRATRMFPPAHMTMVSIPSLLTGRTYVKVETRAPSEVLLTYDPSMPPVHLGSQGTIFTEARQRGFNVGIAGWFFPYCRLIPECTACSWHSAIGLSVREQFETPHSVLQLMKGVFVGQTRKIPLFYRMNLDLATGNAKRLHALSYTQVHGDMLRSITDPRLNLVYVHMNVPHLPAIYDSSIDRISTSRNITYLDNLRLVDRTIRDIRETLEKAGMWDASTILLTADHPLRITNPAVWRDHPEIMEHPCVPYLLKMPGQTQGLTYSKPEQEVVTKDLLVAILSKQVTTPDQVAAWLDTNPPRQ